MLQLQVIPATKKRTHCNLAVPASVLKSSLVADCFLLLLLFCRMLKANSWPLFTLVAGLVSVAAAKRNQFITNRFFQQQFCYQSFVAF